MPDDPHYTSERPSERPTVSVPRAGKRIGPPRMNLPRRLHAPGFVLLALIWAAWLWHLPQGGDMREWGISAQALAHGRWDTLLLHMFAHANILHIGMNSAVLAGFAPLLVLTMGGRDVVTGGPLGAAALRFYAFYLLAGLAGALLYVAINPGGVIPAVGASGAISGMIGFMSRLDGNGSLLPVTSRALARRIWDFVKANLILIAIFAIPFFLGGTGMLIAWEGHLGGFLFGLLFAGFFLPPGHAPRHG
ncbi:rhomboid family intramembrane serine protease [Altererythrobacter palmitatis]|uniref:Rhomboid family intramembrane serine protease n=2 Tax=Alteraurantiacibacter palmitatis TaxID=2054628 RepID=A0ABV7EC11_9SPHN